MVLEDKVAVVLGHLLDQLMQEMAQQILEVVAAVEQDLALVYQEQVDLV